jgi:hypothetical protein
MAHHSSEARRVRRDLDKELAASAAASGRNLVWSAAETQVLRLISAAIDRKVDLSVDYAAATDAKVRVKLSAEVRLLGAHIARLLKQVKTELPGADESGVREGPERAAGALAKARRVIMPIDADRGHRNIVPGLWDYERGRLVEEIERGDPRGLGLDPAERQALNDSPNSTVSAARAAPARVDELGYFETWPPSARRFPAVASIAWLAPVPGSPARVRIHADDTIAPRE